MSADRRENPDQREKPWICSRCQAEFYRKDLWARHLKVRHSDADADDVIVRRVSPSHRPTPLLEPFEEEHDLSYSAITEGPQSLALIANSNETAIEEQDDPVGNEWDFAWQTSFMDTHEEGHEAQPVDLSWLFGVISSEANVHEGISSTMHVTESTGAVFDIAHSSASDYQHVAGDSQLPRPTCGFRICTALAMQHRKALLTCIGAEMAEIEPAVLSLASMQHGVHLFSRFISKEYPVVHSQTFLPAEEHRPFLEDQLGLSCPVELIWAIVTFGWSILDGAKYEEHRNAARIVQSSLRRQLLTVRQPDHESVEYLLTSCAQHPQLSFRPPLWLLQTLYLCLAFSRYHGTESDYECAIMFHGLLTSVGCSA